MAETRHAVIRTDLLHGTDDRSSLVSFKYMGSDGATETAIDNGNIVKLEGLMPGEREIYVAKTPASTDKLADVVVVASVEMMYDERKRNLDEFYNEPGHICRGYRALHSGEIFSVTSEAFDGTPAKDSEVTIGATTKLKVGGSGTKIGKIIEVEKSGRHTYYAVKVN